MAEKPADKRKHDKKTEEALRKINEYLKEEIMARKSMAQQEAEMRDQYRNRDLEGMKDPKKWPNWPYLPMKHWDGKNMLCGVIVADQGPVVFMANMYAMPSDLTTAQQLKFDSFEAMLDAGWKVD